ncbi:hypothetical protein V6N13_125303 [Hibiscus sabdariffa]
MIQPVATVISSGEVSADTVDFVNSTNEGLFTDCLKSRKIKLQLLFFVLAHHLILRSIRGTQGVFEEYESSSYEKLVSPIDAHPSKVVQAVMKSFFAKIYKR